LAAETWVNSNLLKLFDRKTVMKSSPLGYFSSKSNKNPVKTLLFLYPWIGQAPRKTNKIERNTGTETETIPIF
jgi:hypothetical protein